MLEIDSRTSPFFVHFLCPWPGLDFVIRKRVAAGQQKDYSWAAKSDLFPAKSNLITSSYCQPNKNKL